MKQAVRHLSGTALVCAALLLAAPASATAADGEAYVISIKDHAFSPAELVIPAGKKVKITVKNLDSTPIEFESHELHREKIIGPQGQGVVSVGPLKPGTYPYFDEFHPAAKGVIKAE